MSILSLDFETQSCADLKKTGAHVYAEHDTTSVICMAYAFDDEPVEIWTRGEPFPQRVMDHVRGNGEVHAWNIHFELAVWERTLTRQAPVPTLTVEQCWDTMARAAYWGLPMSLDKAGPASGANIYKDKTGHQLMLRMSRPRSLTLDGTPRWWADEDPKKLAALKAYCVRDVETERAIASRLPPLPDAEREIWLMDARMNLRGLMIDRPLVEALQDLTEISLKQLSSQMRTITKGAVPSVSNVTKLTEWLRLQGLPVESLAKADMGDLLNTPGLSEPVRQALLTRQTAAKTSTAKLKAMLHAAGTDDRVRGLVVHYGANRTGRWCLAEGSMVLVNTNGVVSEKPIETVTTDDLVWDGDNWVEHEGVVFSGEKEVIEHDGVVATPEHNVYLHDRHYTTLADAKRRGVPLWKGNRNVHDL